MKLGIIGSQTLKHFNSFLYFQQKDFNFRRFCADDGFRDRVLLIVQDAGSISAFNGILCYARKQKKRSGWLRKYRGECDPVVKVMP